MLPLELGFALLTLAGRTSAGPQSFTSKSETAASLLLTQWYNSTSGLWDTTGWWQGANTMTTLADLASLDSSVFTSVSDIISNTYVQVPKSVPGYLNDYYDDEGWWALAWIQAYNITQNPSYLQNAVNIFNDMTTGWSIPCGGMWWNKPHTYIAAISNELFFSTAAHLANIIPSDQSYLAWALQEWEWFSNSGIINSNNLINDGIDYTTCKNNNGTIFSYNQGVLLGGLVELNRAWPNSSYMSTATTIASAAIDYLSDSNGIIAECSTDCDLTKAQFKGVFMRNLQILQQAAPNAKFETFIKNNADSVWNVARDMWTNELGSAWDAPFVGPGNATAQSAALDALVAAAAVFG